MLMPPSVSESINPFLRVCGDIALLCTLLEIQHITPSKVKNFHCISQNAEIKRVCPAGVPQALQLTLLAQNLIRSGRHVDPPKASLCKWCYLLVVMTLLMAFRRLIFCKRFQGSIAACCSFERTFLRALTMVLGMWMRLGTGSISPHRTFSRHCKCRCYPGFHPARYLLICEYDLD